MRNILFFLILSVVVWFGCETNPVFKQTVDDEITLPGNANFQVIPNLLHTAVGKQSTFRLVKTANNLMQDITIATFEGTNIASYQYDSQIKRWKVTGLSVGEGEVIFTDELGYKTLAKVKIDSILTFNKPPVAVAYPEYPNGNVAPATVVLKGYRSYDPEGEFLTSSWELLDGTNLGTSQDVTLNNLAAGDYVAILTITDPAQDKDMEVVSFSVVNPAVTVNFPPTAIGYSRFSGGNIAPATAELIGDQSYDPENGSLDYVWKTLSNNVIANQVNTSKSNLSAGTHYFKLYVTDDNQKTGLAIVSAVVVDPEDTTNYAPVVFAYPEFPNGNVAPADVNLVGSNSYDPEGESLTSSWELSDGINIGSSADVSLTGLTAGNYSAILTITDPQGHQDVCVVSFMILEPFNAKPSAVAFYELPNGNVEPARVVLNGSYSSDPEGEQLDYEWRKSSGLIISNNSNHTIDDVPVGTYNYILKVSDPSGNYDETAITVVVGSQNFSPVSVAYAQVQSNVAPTQVVWDASYSYDPEASSLIYRWKDVTNGNVLATGVQYPKTYNNPGIYAVLLEVEDTDGSVGSSIADVTVIAPQQTINYPPNAVIYPEPCDFVAPTPVVWNGTLSGDPEGRSLNYEWIDTLGNVLSTNQKHTIQYDYPGEYTVFLRVTDSEGNSDLSSHTVMIQFDPENTNWQYFTSEWPDSSFQVHRYHTVYTDIMNNGNMNMKYIRVHLSYYYYNPDMIIGLVLGNWNVVVADRNPTGVQGWFDYTFDYPLGSGIDIQSAAEMLMSWQYGPKCNAVVLRKIEIWYE